MAEKPVIIVGGGIAGLASALAMANTGREAIVLERAAAFADIGAGLQLGPNAVRALRTLKLWDAVEPITRQPQNLVIRDALSGRTVKRLDLAHGFERRFGAPYRVAHRADLHAALMAAARAQNRIHLKAGSDVLSLATMAQEATVTTTTGDNHTGIAVLGCDGINSTIRSLLFPGPAVRETGKVIHRALLAPDCGERAGLAKEDVTLWMGPGMHAVTYAVGREGMLNMVCVTPALRTPGDFSPRLSPLLSALFNGVTEWRVWPANFVASLEQWHAGKCLLLGDAAHGTVPYLAQGAAMALEDAAMLQRLAETREPVENWGGRLQQSRQPRTGRLHRMSFGNERVYGLSGVSAGVRNAMMRAMPASIFWSPLAWLYGQ